MIIEPLQIVVPRHNFGAIDIEDFTRHTFLPNSRDGISRDIMDMHQVAFTLAQGLELLPPA
jgi:hypothetical protein